ncbi:hypothetical protein [Demequina sp. NBRC 110052]|uniref:DUF7507 domain-containing protein n=1 Tax=Demequina sp. NBRC 110052 TaxID=1570341 RepID=UPI0013564F4F|nr:hypothetical protein [Demequina sp. NBRC 110052]
MAVIAALVASVLVAAPAAAAEYDPSNNYDADNGYAGFTWGNPYLWTDVDGDGLPDDGDEVVYPFELDIDFASVALLGFTIPGTVASGAYGTSGWSTKVTVGSAMLAADGSGPSLSGGAVQLTRNSDGGLVPLSVSAPPVLYTASTINIVVEETHGNTTDGLPAEGDRVTYTVTTRINGTPDTVINLGGLTHAVFVDGQALLMTPWVTVTAQHMLDGEVPLPPSAAEIHYLDGTGAAVAIQESYAPDAVETEAIDVSFDADVTLQWRDATRSTTRGLGEGEVGDLIDYSLHMENTGNITLDLVEASRVSPSYGGGLVGARTDAAGLAPGASLPTPSLTVANLSSDPDVGGALQPMHVSSADLTRGYIDMEFRLAAAPTLAMFLDGPASATVTVTKRFFLRKLTTDVTWSVEFELLDSNGDGVGQVGEQIRRTWTVTNGADSEQAIEIDKVWSPVVPEDAQPTQSPALSGRVVSPGESASDAVVFDILTGWVLATSFGVTFHGVIDDEVRRLSDVGEGFPLGPYVAPATTLDVTHDYVDTNGDGYPSIGDTVTFTSIVENTGAYPLTEIVLSDAASDVLGTLPPDASLAPGATLTWDVVHVLTWDDFNRGSLTYDVTVDATGLSQLTDSDTVVGVGFAALAADLTEPTEGVIVLCVDGVEVTELEQGASFTVHAGDCAGPQLGPDDKVYVFSTPMMIGNGHVALLVPTSLEPGAHSVAVYAENGTLIGWAPLDVTAPPVVVEPVVTDAEVDAMPATGPDGSTWTLAWVALLAVVLGGAAVALPRRREGGR